jgi:kinesin family protein 2/24
MLGDGSQVRGLYILAAEDIFKQLHTRNGIEVWLSFYEIYCGKLYDLLNDKAILFAR